MTDMLHDIEPREPAPRCPHCAALAARVERLSEEVLAYHRWYMESEYGYVSQDRAELVRRTYAEADYIIDGDLTDAPKGTEVEG